MVDQFSLENLMNQLNILTPELFNEEILSDPTGVGHRAALDQTSRL